MRYKVTEIRCYKPGQVPGYEWTRRWTNNISEPVQNWASGDVKCIRVSDGYSSKSIEVRVRQFIPQDGDKLERSWNYKGLKRSVVIPPYALIDLEQTKESYMQHIESSMYEAFASILGSQHSMLYKTYLQAWTLMQDPSTPKESLDILKLTLKLWMSIRLSTTSVFIIGHEMLGMKSDILDASSPHHGKVPLPPVLGAQLDLILIHHIQAKLRRELLDKLQKLMLKNKPSTWFTTYLVVFILLHNMSLITAHDASYARKHGMQVSITISIHLDELHVLTNTQ